jgi:hypothetical protein
LNGVSSWFVPLVTGSGVTLIVTFLLDTMRHRRARADAAEDAARLEGATDRRRVEERSEEAATAIAPLLDRLRSLFDQSDAQEGPADEELDDLLLAIRKDGIAITDPEIRRRLDILVECAQDPLAVRNYTGQRPRQVIWRATSEAREALGQLIRQETITADKASLETYKSALEEDRQLMEEQYEVQRELERQRRAQEQHGAAD